MKNKMYFTCRLMSRCKLEIWYNRRYDIIFNRCKNNFKIPFYYTTDPNIKFLKYETFNFILFLIIIIIALRVNI